MKVSDFEGVDYRKLKQKSWAKSQETQSEDWDEDMHQMEVDEAQAMDQPNEPMLNLFNLLSLPMQRFWRSEDRTMPDPTEMHAKPTADPVAMLYDQPSDEPMPELEVESVAEMSVLRLERCALRQECCKAHTEALSRFECFCRSLRDLVRDAIFT